MNILTSWHLELQTKIMNDMKITPEEFRDQFKPACGDQPQTIRGYPFGAGHFHGLAKKGIEDYIITML